MIHSVTYTFWLWIIYVLCFHSSNVSLGVSFSTQIEANKTLLIVVSWIKSVYDSDHWVAFWNLWLFFYSYSNLFLFFCNKSILDYRKINFGSLLKYSFGKFKGKISKFSYFLIFMQWTWRELGIQFVSKILTDRNFLALLRLFFRFLMIWFDSIRSGLDRK